MVPLRPDAALASAAAEALLAEMAARLAHTGAERTDVWYDPPSGFAIARSRSPHAVPLPWPARRSPDGVQLFADGALHADAPDPAAAPSALRGFFVAGLVDPSTRRVVIAA